jgi:hypothetical protein
MPPSQLRLRAARQTVDRPFSKLSGIRGSIFAKKTQAAFPGELLLFQPSNASNFDEQRRASLLRDGQIENSPRKQAGRQAWLHRQYTGGQPRNASSGNIIGMATGGDSDLDRCSRPRHEGARDIGRRWLAGPRNNQKSAPIPVIRPGETRRASRDVACGDDQQHSRQLAGGGDQIPELHRHAGIGRQQGDARGRASGEAQSGRYLVVPAGRDANDDQPGRLPFGKDNRRQSTIGLGGRKRTGIVIDEIPADQVTFAVASEPRCKFRPAIVEAGFDEGDGNASRIAPRRHLRLGRIHGAAPGGNS